MVTKIGLFELEKIAITRHVYEVSSIFFVLIRSEEPLPFGDILVPLLLDHPCYGLGYKERRRVIRVIAFEVIQPIRIRPRYINVIQTNRQITSYDTNTALYILCIAQ